MRFAHRWILRGHLNTTALSVLIVASWANPFAHPGSVPSEATPVVMSIEYYPVEGTTSAEILNSLNARGPLDQRGVRRYARSEWSIRWEWPLTPVGPQLQAATSSTEIRLILPYLKNQASVPQALRDEWAEYLNRLIIHELRHAQYPMVSGPQVASAIRSAAGSTGLTPAQAHQAAEKILSRIRARDRRYDRETEHGKLEGVVFPDQADRLSGLQVTAAP